MGKLVVLEGIDGVGKTSCVKELKAALLAEGIPVIWYEEVENKSEGFNVLKPFVKKHASVTASFFFYVASGLDKSRNIERLLRDHWVICDRYIYSTVAFHVAQGLDPLLIPNFSALPLRMPDFYFLITAHDEVRLQRISKRLGSSKDELEPNTTETVTGRKEQVFRSFDPIVIDNTREGIGYAMGQMWEKIVTEEASSRSLAKMGV